MTIKYKTLAQFKAWKMQIVGVKISVILNKRVEKLLLIEKLDFTKWEMEKRVLIFAFQKSYQNDVMPKWCSPNLNGFFLVHVCFIFPQINRNCLGHLCYDINWQPTKQADRRMVANSIHLCTQQRACVV